MSKILESFMETTLENKVLIALTHRDTVVINNVHFVLSFQYMLDRVRAIIQASKDPDKSEDMFAENSD